MIWVRSLAFSVVAGAWTLAMTLVFLPLLLWPPTTMQKAARAWCRGVLTLARVLCGLRHRVVGRENLPAGAVIIAAKHQSTWDTLIFHLLLPDPVYILKKELLAVPLLGWYLRHIGNIAIDRAAGFRALKGMLRPVDEALARGAQVIIFPEGTRVAPGERRPYQPGVAALYAHARAPVVPVALNSGLFWRRRGFLKQPGRVTLEFLPPIAPGRTRVDFLATLESVLETASERLLTAEPAGARDHPARNVPRASGKAPPPPIR